MSSADLVARRAHVLASGYTTFYDEPLHLVRGAGVWMYDAEGRGYLDCYNNVASVGHCHPRVVDAICRQTSTLNTHTRYLHEHVVELAERLGNLLPGDLSACWLTCTGTESNDLAVQVARAVTGHHGVIVFESAYHGNSTLVHALSPEDCRPPNRPDWVAVVEPPNAYRGPVRDTGTMADAHVEMVRDAVAELERRGHGVAAILVDASFESNGVLVPPDSFLSDVAGVVRSAGGLLIADEVQAGYCRLGAHWWGHQHYGLVPDLVTIGKPMGAGFPVSACVTTPAISAAFGEQRSYFNTFGGNPVAAAAALAVIDVIEDEGLLDNCRETGEYLGAGLAALTERHEMVGAVTGRGLFWGIDLVTDRESRAPLPVDAARRLVSDLAAEGVLMGLVGRFGNIVKVRPPLTLGREHVDRALEALDVCLGRL